MVDDDSLRSFLTGLGYSPGAPIGSGMEGIVHRVDDSLVAKAWFHRAPAELTRMADFYRELAAQGLPFATPELVDIFTLDGRAVTVERELHGTALPTAIRDGKISSESAQAVMLSVAVMLRQTKAGAASRALTVLDETTSMRAQDQSWAKALASLVRRRAETFHVLRHVRLGRARRRRPPDAAVGVGFRVSPRPAAALPGRICGGGRERLRRRRRRLALRLVCRGAGPRRRSRGAVLVAPPAAAHTANGASSCSPATPSIKANDSPARPISAA
jgi:hypothetical protein